MIDELDSPTREYTNDVLDDHQKQYRELVARGAKHVDSLKSSTVFEELGADGMQ